MLLASVRDAVKYLTMCRPAPLHNQDSRSPKCQQTPSLQELIGPKALDLDVELTWPSPPPSVLWKGILVERFSHPVSLSHTESFFFLQNSLLHHLQASVSHPFLHRNPLPAPGPPAPSLHGPHHHLAHLSDWFLLFFHLLECKLHEGVDFCSISS